MLDRLLVERKAAHVAQYLDQLRRHGQIRLQRFTEDLTTRYAVERLMQLIVDEAIDINGHVILATRQAPPRDYYASFIQLGRLGACSRSLASSLAPTTALRNALVHEYEDVDVKEVHRNIQRFLSFYPRYLREVLRFVKRFSPQR